MSNNSYNFAEPEINPEKWLYHYTSFETAIKYILPTRKLKIGEYGNVNDPKESKLNPTTYSFEDFPLDESEGKAFELERDEICEKITNYFFHKIKIVCFSVDDIRYEKTLFNYFARGSVKPRMWAQYGDNNKGVCLIFDKSVLNKEVEKQFSNDSIIYKGNVTYQSSELIEESWKLQNQINIESNNFSLTSFKYDFENAIQNQIHTHQETYFFHKYEDWKAENEFRFVIYSQKDGDFYLNFGDALSGIVVGSNFDQKHENELLEGIEKLGVPATQFSYGLGWTNQRQLGTKGLGQIHAHLPSQK